MNLANITSNTAEINAVDVSVATSIIEDLTTAAITNEEVRFYCYKFTCLQYAIHSFEYLLNLIALVLRQGATLFYIKHTYQVGKDFK